MSMTPSGESLDVYLETLRRIVNTLGPQRSFHSSLRGLLRTLAERHAFLRPHLVIYDPEARTLRLCLADTPPTDEGVVYQPGVGITGQVFTLGRPVIVERISDNAVFQNKFFIRTPEETATLAFLSVPVFGHGEEPSDGLEVLGVLSVDTPVAPRAVLETRCRFLEVVAGLIGQQVSYLQREMTRRVDGMPGAEAREIDAASAVVAVSKTMRRVVRQVTQAAASRVSVLLRGEPGVGKELLAELLHKAGPRREMPLVRVNCAALPAGSALDAELFGVQKGAVPDALQTRKGLLEAAHRGTLCLSGVEALPDAVQMHLLRVMQEQELLRVGGSRPVAVDVRIVCTTPHAPEILLGQGVRRDLLQRLSGMVVDIPPLREHTEDILPLAEHFLQHAADAQNKSIRRISTPAIELLQRHAWPGNVRELRNCLERAVTACEEDTLRAWHLPPSFQAGNASAADGVGFAEAVARFEQELLADALQKTRGNMLEASRLLDASYRIINYKVKKYGLDPKKFAVRQS